MSTEIVNLLVNKRNFNNRSKFPVKFHKMGIDVQIIKHSILEALKKILPFLAKGY